MSSADEVVTQGDVHEEIDLLCNLNVEDLKISYLVFVESYVVHEAGVLLLGVSQFKNIRNKLNSSFCVAMH